MREEMRVIVWTMKIPIDGYSYRIWERERGGEIGR
jgi:hypothetical protein